MFTFKKNYYLFIENTRDIDLSNIKFSTKFIIIYRNKNKIENFDKLLKFRRNCKSKRIDFFIANNIKLLIDLRADGLYISAHNKDLNLTRFRKTNFKIIGSAHNAREINIKNLQGCSNIIFSRLFETSYAFKRGFMGIVRFNLLTNARNENLLPLGGIKLSNLNKLKIINCRSFALLSEIKKKPAIVSRLF
jgi:thiamine-phosphate pyrophosphorylase